jgi:3-dehydroquinate synthase
MPEIIARTATADYPIFIQQGALDHLGERIAACVQGRRAVIVTDDQVGPLYLERASRSLRAAGFSCSEAVVPAGEASKTPEQLASLYARFQETGLSRADPVIALGGGVVGDLAGFAAATWLRGVPLAQVPTTLLAQVDSSIGGKTGIDLPQGKNLIGAFYQPRLVVMDPAVLHTLPRRFMADGMAEVIKYGLIGDEPLLDQVEQQACDLEWVVSRCVRSKIAVVARDEKDNGERMLLNFGHTVGHAIEKATGFNAFSHGEAVAVGMVIAARVGEQLGETEPGTCDRIRRVLEAYQLPVRADIPLTAILLAIKSDKKRLGSRIHYVLLRRPGEAFLKPMAPEELADVLGEVWPRG